jgi:REP element-mobilizing transposase RayT
MAFAYSIKDEKGLYFVTFTITQWVDVFTREVYVNIFLDSLRYCQKEKGLLVYAWVVMSNHVHLIIRSEQEPLSDTIRDIKKFTSTQIVNSIEQHPKESRKSWLLWLLKKEGRITFWQAGYHGEEITSDSFMKSKVDYIHNNPVRAGIVSKAEEYTNSSALTFIKGECGKLKLYTF